MRKTCTITFLSFLLNLFSPYCQASPVKASFRQLESLDCEELYDIRIVPDRCFLKTLTPAFKDQQVLKFICANGLPVVVVSDPSLPTSGACLVVGSGSSEDPLEFPGLAHFTEHSIFLGNRKYPQPEEFSSFLSKNGGKYNAFTFPHKTVYLFSVNNSAFFETLDRFTSMFTYPLFAQEYLDKEKNAVQQEFARNTLLDERRIQRISEIIAPQDHVFHRFHCGNLETLAPVKEKNIQRWYAQHYSPENMRALVYTSASIEDSIKSVAKAFSWIPISNRYKPNKIDDKHSLTYPLTIFVTKAIQSKRYLNIHWHFSDKDNISPTCGNLIARILSSKEKGSLQDTLFKEDLIISTQANFFRCSGKSAIMDIDFRLTQKGAENYETIITRLFQTLKLLKDKGIPPHCFKESVRMREINYCFRSKEPLFDLLCIESERLLREDVSTYPHRSISPLPFSKNEEKHCLSKLCNPSAARYILSTPDILSNKEASSDPLLSKSISTQQDIIFPELVIYEVPFTESCKKSLNNLEIHNELKLPSKNLFIPAHIENFPLTEPISEGYPFSVTPEHTSSKMQSFYCQDNYYTTPKAACYLRIKTPLLKGDDAKQSVLAKIYCLAVKNAIRHVTYQAEAAGIESSIAASRTGIDIELFGYTENLPLVLQKILFSLRNVEVNKKKFQYYLSTISDESEAAIAACPILSGIDYLYSQSVTNFCSNQEKLKACQEVSFEDYKNFQRRVYDDIFLESMVFGNLSIEERAYISSIFEHFSEKSKTFSITDQALRLNKTGIPRVLDFSYPLPANAMLFVLQNPYIESSIDNTVATEMLIPWLKNIYFKELRTQQQTGYVVSALYREINTEPLVIFFIQSENHSPDDLLDRTKIFLNQVTENLEEYGLTREGFQAMQKAYIKKFSSPEISFDQMNCHLFSNCFDKSIPNPRYLEDKIDAAEKLTYEECIEYCKDLLRNNKNSVSVRILGRE
ncbi:insulinase family protein [Chlamydiifrater phoenicopteri]|uniref:insulinase family protein n=1 Tax=Chlamydiifrater phoenicopteri TaxID=2681469 RepID=UPI001BCFE364|nr:insulinase family protein [Chlamydiifrater phoenicopteri]